MDNPENLWAHSPQGDREAPHLLLRHLWDVAALAEAFAAKFRAGAIGRMLGLIHDAAKACLEFQRYIRDPNSRKGPPHSDPGAAAYLEELGLFSLCVQAHHGRLPNHTESAARIDQTQKKYPEVVQAAKQLQDSLQLPACPTLDFPTEALVYEHLIRMCFSALIDADRLDTERYYQPDLRQTISADLPPLLEKLEAKLAAFRPPQTEVERVRVEVQEHCRRSALEKPGFYRLAVPTGGGKTLASMLFGLTHAKAHELDRIIVAIPFTSIIEQNAAIYEGIFGPENVLEHHSNYGANEETNAEGQSHVEIRRRLAAENWDMPLIVTTNVQFFESLLSDHGSKCRKLHNIARSVVILDEVQTLPPNLLEPMLSVLDWMVQYANTSVVFCTATQPDYSRLPNVPESLRQAIPIVPEPEQLFARLNRVDYTYVGKMTHEEVAARIAGQDQALCIVNSRADSVRIFETLDDPDAFYLSTYLVPAHRKKVLAQIRERLDQNLPCRVVSTQVVEAGVDIDFPYVLRMMAPLDSIVQAGGRCNRNGRTTKGRCEIFDLIEGKTPKGSYLTGTDLTRPMLQEGESALETPETQSSYFQELFRNVATDKKVGGLGIQDLRNNFDYPKVAARTKLIDDDSVGIIVEAYDPELAEKLFEQLANGASPRLIARKFAPMTVSLRHPGSLVAERQGFLVWTGSYDGSLGVGKQTGLAPEDSVV